jgi:hypothetical protein
MNGSRFYNRTDSIFIIDAIALFEPFGDQSSFITIKRPINIVLNLENPPIVYYIRSNNRRHQMSSVILQYSRIFIFHCMFPPRILKCLRYRLMFPCGVEICIHNYLLKQFFWASQYYFVDVSDPFVVEGRKNSLKAPKSPDLVVLEPTVWLVKKEAQQNDTEDPHESPSRQVPGGDTPAAGDTARTTEAGWCIGSEIIDVARSEADSGVG